MANNLYDRGGGPVIHDRSDWPRISTLVEISHRAYTQSPTIYSRKTGCEVLVVNITPDLVVVAPRGTSNFQDAWMDARCAPWYDSDLKLGWCHRGFLIGVRSVWPDLLPKLLGKRVIFTGHSKGGSETSLAAGAACHVEGIYPVGVFPFGPARCVIGDKLNRLYKSRGLTYLRFEENGDPVPEVPPFMSHPAPNHISLGEAWDTKADHPLMRSYHPDVVKWEKTHGWLA